MSRKFLLFSLLAVVSVIALVVLSAVTVFALIGDNQTQVEEVRIIDETLELTTSEVVESSSQPQIVEPVLRYEYADYAGQAGGCSYSAKEQLTEAPDEQIENQVLTLAE